MYQDELDTLKPEELNELVEEFFELVFSEDENNFAYHVMGIVHDGARYIPDLLEHMAENYSNLTVKVFSAIHSLKPYVYLLIINN